jgi:hypothetical protein
MTGARLSFRSLTLPFVADNHGFYGEIKSAFANITNPFTKTRPAAMGTLAFQAFPSSIGQQSEKRGGNAMGLSAKDKNRFIIELNYLWNKEGDDQAVWQMGKDLTDMLEKKLVQFKSNAKGNTEGYLPLFMNDAAHDQDVIATYKNVAMFKQLQNQHDPQGFWKRAGGFKYKS